MLHYMLLFFVVAYLNYSSFVCYCYCIVYNVCAVFSADSISTIFSYVMKSQLDAFLSSSTAAGKGPSVEIDIAMISTLVRATVELQSRLESFYMPIVERCHYAFTLSGLSSLFWYVMLTFKFLYVVVIIPV